MMLAGAVLLWSLDSAAVEIGLPPIVAVAEEVVTPPSTAVVDVQVQPYTPDVTYGQKVPLSFSTRLAGAPIGITGGTVVLERMNDAGDDWEAIADTSAVSGRRSGITGEHTYFINTGHAAFSRRPKVYRLSIVDFICAGVTTTVAMQFSVQYVHQAGQLDKDKSATNIQAGGVVLAPGSSTVQNDMVGRVFEELDTGQARTLLSSDPTSQAAAFDAALVPVPELPLRYNIWVGSGPSYAMPVAAELTGNGLASLVSSVMNELLGSPTYGTHNVRDALKAAIVLTVGKLTGLTSGVGTGVLYRPDGTTIAVESTKDQHGNRTGLVVTL